MTKEEENIQDVDEEWLIQQFDDLAKRAEESKKQTEEYNRKRWWLGFWTDTGEL